LLLAHIMSLRERSKRATSSTEIPSSDLPPTKKTRFLDPADDAANFAEEVDAALENPSATRKGRVKTEGYESDSSDDGEGVVFSRRSGADGAAAKDDEDDDMFAIDGPKEAHDQSDAGSKKKGEEFLRLGDIEGQEFGRGSGDEGESSSDEGEPLDEDDAERRKKVGMGYEISSFNMREEMEEGKFSADGTYVRNFDPHVLHDRWMDGLGEREIKLARKRKRRQEKAERERMQAEEREIEQLGGKEAIEREVLAMLKKGETVLEALQRLGARAKQQQQNKAFKQSGCVLPPFFPVDFFFGAWPQMTFAPIPSSTSRTAAKASSQDPRASTDKRPSSLPDVEQLTHLASTLLELGDTDIYSRTYEEIVRTVRSAGKVEPSWVPPSADVKYEYKWDVPGSTGEQGQVFGPYSEEEMQSWYKASYFGLTGEKVKVRPVAGDWGSWSDVL
jgi:CD2 antigen cytoplasmic tail-binding protein 2